MNDKLKKHLKHVLKSNFGYEDFRPGQLEVLDALLKGKSAMAILPTGAGKTLIYQMFGLMRNHTILIVSPLISLMQDQVNRMHYLGYKNSIAFNSTLSNQEKHFVIRNIKKYKYIYVSPEMLSDHGIQEIFKSLCIDLLVIDEAHCISQWGVDFRPEYLDLASVIRNLNIKQVLMLTATASKKTRFDIVEKLNLSPQNVELISCSVNRDNIFLNTHTFSSLETKQNYLIRLLSVLKVPGIIYFSSKKVANQVTDLIKAKTSLNVEAYHSGISDDNRYRIQQQFMNNKLDLVCATSAFGMGIDKNNIRFIIHYHLPTTLEEYMQEIGRAGRDGKQSISIVLYQDSDIGLANKLALGDVPSTDEVNFFFDNAKIFAKTSNEDEKIKLLKYYYSRDYSKNYVINIFNNLVHQKIIGLKALHEYVNLQGCLRKYLLNYFDEQFSEHNDKCCASNSTVDLKLLGLFNKNVVKSNQNHTNWRDIINSLFYNVNI
ncbi:RecQ family ATP-dependent DNA helicase [Apilactobacillus sp. TMW 2.2459]|uniref:RecQ family ATP-dependent DNA helicase n=1 Tax=Apilactobacillus xinyiensis TaxID=2841032 RepID=UPI00200CA67D|nr:RecQ family ATP-dependent DNA helicase [Apilactobacillus xinyiensis]MCL0311676.1 RecQ family ATP-dependent DNA helicase [Apilactobacillus xinyiensis]